MSKRWLPILVLVLAVSASADRETALQRVAVTADGLILAGDRMQGEPVSGVLLLNDTLTVELEVATGYCYTFVIWTDSAFNYVDFWMKAPDGSIPRGDLGDHATFGIIPDSAEAGIWELNMELLEGAYSDSCWFAAGVFRGERSLSQ